MAYVIITGNPGDGFDVIVDGRGFPYEDPDEATADAELNCGDQDWWVVPATPVTDLDGLAAEDDEDEEDDLTTGLLVESIVTTLDEIEEEEGEKAGYEVAVYYLAHDNIWRYVGTWAGAAGDDADAERRAFAAFEDGRIAGWKAEIVRRPDPSYPS